MIKQFFIKSFILVIISIFVISCNSKGDKQVISSYQNGKPQLVYFTKDINGSKQKTFEQYFYENGKLKYEGAFKDNAKTGVWIYYYDSGNKFAECDYTGSVNGKDWEVYNLEKKKLIKKNDNFQEIAFFPDGCPALIKIKKANDEKEYKFFPSFKLMEDRTYIGNILNGKSISYFEDGKVNSIHNYKDGIPDGSYVLYHDNGNKQITGQYKMGIKVDKWSFFKKDGSSDGEDLYDINGKVLKKRDSGLKYYDKNGNEVIM